ncbi:GPW/gp25 family protein [Paraburkholderia caribensis]|uniref:GPW/gp25 family protein n=1 Tax=Paraburkholderia caribensis TaxID=75105 RepID=UPI001D060A8C|nr:GPW/gp25 family protein [Paraburkholderia caribensis]
MSRLAFPFGVAASGRSATVEYGSDEHVRQMLHLLILTLCGERVMRPDVGSPVLQMLFAAGAGPVAVALQATLQAAITQWLGHLLEVQELSVSFDETTAVLDIDIAYETLASRAPGRYAIQRQAA